jgi:hypothetical protein
METLREAGSIVISRSPGDLYEMISDVTRMGEWSPICKTCWWDEGAGPRVGAIFTGRNEDGQRTWETRSEIAAADPGKEFAWVVQATGTRWGYTFAAVDGGTKLTETWEFPPAAADVFKQRFGDDAEAQIATRRDLARDGIGATLAAIKAAAEDG